MRVKALVMAVVLGLLSGLTAMADTPFSAPLVLVHDGEHWGGGEVECPTGYAPVYLSTRVDCAPIYGDAGRFCTSASQCVGECLASFDGNGGYCARTRLGAGCFDVLLDSGERVSLCID